MSELREMMSRMARPGRVDWIGLRPAHRAGLVPVAGARLEMAGLVGDHARPGKRALTLFQAEHLAVVGSILGRTEVSPDLLRRNVLVSGINLNALKDREVWIGPALVRVTGPCMPCSRMEEALGFGGYAALRGHGGWCAEVVTPGLVSLGDPVRA